MVRVLYNSAIKKSFLVQVSQYTFAMCSYREKKSEPQELMQLEGYTVDYTAPHTGTLHDFEGRCVCIKQLIQFALFDLTEKKKTNPGFFGNFSTRIFLCEKLRF